VETAPFIQAMTRSKPAARPSETNSKGASENRGLTLKGSSAATTTARTRPSAPPGLGIDNLAAPNGSSHRDDVLWTEPQFTAKLTCMGWSVRLRTSATRESWEARAADSATSGLASPDLGSQETVVSMASARSSGPSVTSSPAVRLRLTSPMTVARIPTAASCPRSTLPAPGHVGPEPTTTAFRPLPAIRSRRRRRARRAGPEVRASPTPLGPCGGRQARSGGGGPALRRGRRQCGRRRLTRCAPPPVPTPAPTRDGRPPPRSSAAAPRRRFAPRGRPTGCRARRCGGCRGRSGPRTGAWRRGGAPPWAGCPASGMPPPIPARAAPPGRRRRGGAARCSPPR